MQNPLSSYYFNSRINRKINFEMKGEKMFIIKVIQIVVPTFLNQSDSNSGYFPVNIGTNPRKRPFYSYFVPTAKLKLTKSIITEILINFIIVIL